MIVIMTALRGLQGWVGWGGGRSIFTLKMSSFFDVDYTTTQVLHYLTLNNWSFLGRLGEMGSALKSSFSEIVEKSINFIKSVILWVTSAIEVVIAGLYLQLRW